jgi:DNA-directed RNA polymerase specialized sigma24 family protein
VLQFAQNEPPIDVCEKCPKLASSSRAKRRVDMPRPKMISITGNDNFPDPQSEKEDVADRLAREETYACCLKAIQSLSVPEREAFLEYVEQSSGENVSNRKNPRSGNSTDIVNRRRRAQYYLQQILGAV